MGAEKQQSQKLIQCVSSLLLLLIFVVSALDRNFIQSIDTPYIALFANLPVLTGLYIIFRVFKENTYTASIVDVEKGQKVISSGPYSIVRHPMYSGASVMFLSTPIALGSLWGIIPATGLCVMMIVRLIEEERYLLQNLNGYAEYKEKVRTG